MLRTAIYGTLRLCYSNILRMRTSVLLQIPRKLGSNRFLVRSWTPRGPFSLFVPEADRL